MKTLTASLTKHVANIVELSFSLEKGSRKTREAICTAFAKCKTVPEAEQFGQALLMAHLKAEPIEATAKRAFDRVRKIINSILINEPTGFSRPSDNLTLKTRKNNTVLITPMTDKNQNREPKKGQGSAGLPHADQMARQAGNLAKVVGSDHDNKLFALAVVLKKLDLTIQEAMAELMLGLTPEQQRVMLKSLQDNLTPILNESKKAKAA